MQENECWLLASAQTRVCPSCFCCVEQKHTSPVNPVNHPGLISHEIFLGQPMGTEPGLTAQHQKAFPILWGIDGSVLLARTQHGLVVILSWYQETFPKARHSCDVNFCSLHETQDGFFYFNHCLFFIHFWSKHTKPTFWFPPESPVLQREKKNTRIGTQNSACCVFCIGPTEIIDDFVWISWVICRPLLQRSGMTSSVCWPPLVQDLYSRRGIWNLNG